MQLSKIIMTITVSLLILVGGSGLLSMAQSAPTQPIDQPSQFVSGELIVKFKSGVGHLAAQRSLRSAGLETLEVSNRGEWLRVQVVPGYEADMMADLMARGDVEYVEYNSYVYAAEVPDDYHYPQQWHLHDSESGGISAEDAWDITTGSESIIIAIIDSGIDLEHPDLAAKVVSPYNYISPSSPAEDDYIGHGTHTSGIAAAISNNAEGVAGVSWGARIMPIKVLDESGRGSIADVAKAIYKATDKGANIINMSFSDPNSKWPCTNQTIQNALEYADERGVLLVAAAGNESSSQVNCPAAAEQTIAVSATNQQGELIVEANYGSQLDVVAPGYRIYSTVARNYTPSGYRTKTGTSMASPSVAGLAALIWSINPDLSHTQVREIIKQTADDLGDAGRDNRYGYGRINAKRAIESLAKFQIDLAQTNFLMDDNTPSFRQTLSLSTVSPTPLTWTISISPAVSWLTIDPPSTVSGTIVADSPAQFDMILSSPAEYGMVSTTVIFTGESPINQSQVTLSMSYVPQIYKTHLPMLVKQ